MPLEVIFPEYARLKFIQPIHVPHIRRDHITIIYIFKNLYYVMSPTNLTCRIYETFFPFHWTQFNHFVKIAKLNSQSRPGWRLSRYGHFRQCAIPKKFPHHLRPRNGGVWFLFKPARYSRDRRGIFLNGRDISGILAGYFNCWGPNLPFSTIRRLSRFMMISFKYHTVFRAVDR